ncbi:hypothetical protein GZL_04188 [Streptomyces sp. 769]|nr:hypothetical protein GZL_04188 [Streptomyces sp. 769]
MVVVRSGPGPPVVRPVGAGRCAGTPHRAGWAGQAPVVPCRPVPE